MSLSSTSPSTCRVAPGRITDASARSDAIRFADRVFTISTSPSSKTLPSAVAAISTSPPSSVATHSGREISSSATQRPANSGWRFCARGGRGTPPRCRAVEAARRVGPRRGAGRGDRHAAGGQGTPLPGLGTGRPLRPDHYGPHEGRPGRGDERDAVRRLAAEGPPEEEVGLAPFAAPQFSPGASAETTLLPMPSFPGARR